MNVGHVGPSSMHRDPNGIPFLMGKNVGPGFISTNNIERVTHEFHCSQPKSNLRPGDIVVVRIGKSGQAAKIPDSLGEANCSGLVIIKQPNRIHPDFLVYYLNSPIGRARSLAQARGSTRLTLNTQSVAETLVPVPPLVEQKRIVGILDEAFAGLATAKANADSNRRNADALMESHLHAVFSRPGPQWRVCQISDIAEHSLGKMLDKAKNKGELQPYLRNLNVRWFSFDLSDVLEMRFLPDEEQRYTAVKGDVLVCEGGYPGRAAVWQGDLPVHFQKALHRVRFHNPEHGPWFVYYLWSSDKSGDLRNHFSGTGIQHFTGQVLAKFRLPIPPEHELRELMARFDALVAESQRLANLYERKLSALAALKQSLLREAFAGAL